jgi:iron complex outermembrane receptor protein
MQSVNTAPSRFLRTCCLFLSVFSYVLSLSAAEPTRSYSIPAGAAESTLKTFADQSGRSVIFSGDRVRGVQTNEVKGDLTAEDALNRLLSGTKLSAVPEKSTGGFAVRREATVEIAEKNALSRPESDRAASQWETAPNGEKVLKLDTFEVFGRKTLNMDIQRTRDDVQPYVIFDRGAIDASGAGTIDEFLRYRLTTSTSAESATQRRNTFGNTSLINLRGLGTNQTLILVDGRRLPSLTAGGTPQQPDLNGIPLSAVERVEVLSAAASGIYGGSATGGVVNVVLRRDYQGAELRAAYGEASGGTAHQQRYSLSASYQLGKKTDLLVSGSWQANERLEVGDRDFVQNGRAAILRNSPNFFFSSALLGATPNIRSANGSPLFGAGTSNVTFVPPGFAGGQLAPFQANAGKYNFDLADTSQGNGGKRSALLAETTVTSVMATIRHEFTPTITAFVDASWSRNFAAFPSSGLFTSTVSATAPNNPFGQNVSVSFPSDGLSFDFLSKTTQVRLAGGVIVKLPRGWNAEADYTHTRTQYNTDNYLPLTAPLLTAISNGTINVLRDTMAFPLDLSPYRQHSLSNNTSSTRVMTVRFAGPLWQLPGGPVILSALAEKREDLLGNNRGLEQSDNGPGTSLAVTGILLEKEQAVHSAYTELKIPLFSATNARPGFYGFEFQAAVRHDAYSVDSGPPRIAPGAVPPAFVKNKDRDLNPTVGVLWKPISVIALRGSYGTAFLPPDISQITPSITQPSAAGSFIDPRRGNTPTLALTRSAAGNPSLRPEYSNSWSAGVIIEPSAIAGLRLSVDYTRIRKSDNIANLAPQQIIDNEALFPERITRGPLAPGDSFTVGPITAIDGSFVNIARAEVEAFDAQLDYEKRTPSVGKFAFSALATWIPHYTTQLAPSVAIVENVATNSTFPLKFKANASVTWSRGQWSLGWTSRYFDSYFVANPSATSSAPIFVAQGGQRVASQLYHDIFFRYRFNAAVAFFKGLELQLNSTNVFNSRPPLDAGANLSFYSPFADPRLRMTTLSLKASF